MRRVIALALIVLSLAAAKAEAVTAKDIIDLARAGLGEEVLLALVEVDGGVFNIDTATLTDLKKAGVSERVIAAMVRSGRTRPPGLPQPMPVYEPDPSLLQPQVIVIEHERPVVEQVVVPVPVFIPVGHRTRVRGQIVTQPFDPSPGFGAPTPPQYQQPQRKAAQPVYWGWGGKLRPDAWKPAPAASHRKDQQHTTVKGGRKPESGSKR